MLHFTRWKTLAILGSVLLAIIFALPNGVPSGWQTKLAEYGLRPMTLGLDLQGGSNVLLEIDRNELRDNLAKQTVGDIRPALRDAKIGYSGIAATTNGVSVRILRPEDADRTKQILRDLVQPAAAAIFGDGGTPSLFDVSQQGEQFDLTFSEPGLDAKIAVALSQIIKIIENRVNGLGVTEATIQQQGKERVVVQLPGIKDPDKVIESLGTTAKLTFQLVCESQPTGPGQRPPADCEAFPHKADVDKLIAEKKARNDTNLEPTQAELDALPNKLWVQTSSRATVDGADLVDARPAFGQQNEPVVSFRFNSKGAERFGRLTRDNVDKPFAIILDKVVVSFPRINEPILGGSGQISGNFSTEETASLAVVLRSGALPAKLVVVEQRTVGPSLGSDSIKAGFKASVIGLILVMVFMIVAYGLFGLIANIALLINLILLIAVMSTAGFTLTLPGIAAIVLTMGMAVDSNVIIFERMREEWRNGRTAINAIETGFKAAFATIIDSNLTAFIAAIVLIGVGSGPVRGFAITHAIGILTTMYTAYTVTRFIVAFWARWAKPKEVPL